MVNGKKRKFISDQTGIDRLSTASLHKYLISQSNMAGTQCIWTCRHGQGGLLKFKAYLMFLGFVFFFGTSFRYLIFVQVSCDVDIHILHGSM